MSANLRNKILLYFDEGSSSTDALHNMLQRHFLSKNVSIGTVNADEIKENALDEQVLALFIGGGYADSYWKKLHPQGNKKIKEFVQKGGFYVGICGGAYYGCKHIEFDADVPQSNIKTDSTLGLLEATAKGTLYEKFGIAPFARNPDSVAIPTVKWLPDDGKHAVYYHGGCSFVPDKNSTTVETLAVYDGIDGELPAIVKGRYGEGLVIASGVHPEKTGDLLAKLVDFHRSNTRFVENAQLLAEKEPERRILERKFLNLLMER